MIFTYRKLANLVTATTSILLIPVMGFFHTPLNYTSNNSLIDLSLSAPAGANTPFQYNPPSRGTPRTTIGTGSRGCTQSLPVTLALLVPNDHTGQTTSPHPTFFWYVSDKIAGPIEFTLVEPGVAKPLLVKQMEVQKAGIMQMELPQDTPELVPGQKYRWSVSLICNARRPSNNVFTQGWVERISPKPEMVRELAAVTSKRDRAQIFAREGLWYDALAAVSTVYNANPPEPSAIEARISLLEQAKLTQVADQERHRLTLQ